jgi:Fe-S cluster assembly protein SufD
MQAGLKTIMATTLHDTDPYRAQFAELETATSGREPAALRALRRRAFDRFLELGFPTTREEEWRYTNVAPIAKAGYPAFPGEASASHQRNYVQPGAVPSSLSENQRQRLLGQAAGPAPRVPSPATGPRGWGAPRRGQGGHPPRFGASGSERQRWEGERWRLASHADPLPDAGRGGISFGDVARERLVWVNGRFAPEFSAAGELPRGVQVGSLAQAFEGNFERVESHLAQYARFDRQPFVALNTALMTDGAFLYVPRGVVVEDPIHLLFLADSEEQPFTYHPRTLILAEESSQVTVLETFIGSGAYFTNAVTEIVLGENAVVDHYRSQCESNAAFHVATLQVQQAGDSNFRSHAVSLGGSLVRNDINAVLAGLGVESTLNGLYVARDRQHVDNHTAIDHAQPHCNSHELYKGILDDAATAVFNGKIFVRQDAQKTDAKQTNQNLLLSRDATINTKPQLEIFADDVRCTHGATVGQLDEDAIFYLRSRGIGLEEARSVLTYAFATDILHRIRVEPLQSALEAELLRRLPR